MKKTPRKTKNDLICKVRCFNEPRVKRARDGALSHDEARRMARLFGVLSDPTRLQMMRALVVVKELCVCDFAHVLGKSVSAVSHQLRLLRDADVVAWRNEGKFAFYSLRDGVVREAFTTMLQQRERLA